MKEMPNQDFFFLNKDSVMQNLDIGSYIVVHSITEKLCKMYKLIMEFTWKVLLQSKVFQKLFKKNLLEICKKLFFG